jgi:serine/threonine-protein kinase
VWAIGLLAFRLIAGRMFWRHAQASASAYELAVELLRAPIPKASERARELGADGALPAGFDAWFARAVARDPAARFEDAGAARAALEAILPLRAGGHAARPGVRVVLGVVVAVIVAGVAAAVALR